jgi:hypothetical protein
MSSKQSKKTNKKKAPVSNKKKAPVKKAVAKKAPAKKKTSAPKASVSATSKNSDLLLTKTSEPKPQFASADKLMKTLAEQSSVVRVNDVKSLPLRKRMLAWFKIYK